MAVVVAVAVAVAVVVAAAVVVAVGELAEVATAVALAALPVPHTAKSCAMNGPWYHPSVESRMFTAVAPVGIGVQYDDACSAWWFPATSDEPSCFAAGWQLAPPSKLTATVPTAANRRKLPAGAGRVNVTAPPLPSTNRWSALMIEKGSDGERETLSQCHVFALQVPS